MLKLIRIFSCLGFICAVVHRPRATPGTNPALRARVWGIFRRGPVQGVRGWGKKKYLLFDFAKCVLFLARFTR